MNIQEYILLALSRKPGFQAYDYNKNQWTIGSSLFLLENSFPNFINLVSGKKVVDFGCGWGYQSIELVQRYKCSVIGIDSNQKVLKRAIKIANSHDIPKSKLTFIQRIDESMMHSFDIVISQNSFEHFSNPSLILNEMSSLLVDRGKILITFGPPWCAPYGSHMHFFCKFPWINVLFSEKTVMKVRGHFRSDGATRYEDVESGLNKMTIMKLERIIKDSKLKLEYKNYECVKGINLFSKIPILREFFINHASVILSMTTSI